MINRISSRPFCWFDKINVRVRPWEIVLINRLKSPIFTDIQKENGASDGCSG